MAGTFAGLFEEIGWTGFVVPLLLRRHGVLATGLIVGFLWGAWHYIAALWGSGDANGAFSAHFFLAPFLFYVVVLPVYRVLMVWVYDRTRSLLVAMLMHASLTANTLFLCLPAAMGEELSIYYLLLGLALWIMVAARGGVHSFTKRVGN
jgi:membrane protease YdiL (CAAX protease family)